MNLFLHNPLNWTEYDNLYTNGFTEKFILLKFHEWGPMCASKAYKW